MKKRVTAVLFLLAATAVSLSAESLSYTGTLNTPQKRLPDHLYSHGDGHGYIPDVGLRRRNER